MAASLAALPALFAGAGTAAAGAATLTGFGSAVIGIGGSIIAGAAQGYMQAKERKEEEQAKIRAEQRVQDNYAGIGDAVDFSNMNFDTKPLLSEKIASAPVVGQAPAPRPKMGDIYKQRAVQKRGSRVPRYRYNRDDGLIEQL